MTPEVQKNLLILLPLLLQMGGLIFAVLIDPYIHRRHRSLLLIIALLVLSLILQNGLENYFQKFTAVGLRTF